METILHLIAILCILLGVLQLYNLSKQPLWLSILTSLILLFIAILCWYANYWWVDERNIEGNPIQSLLVFIQLIVCVIAILLCFIKRKHLSQ